MLFNNMYTTFAGARQAGVAFTLSLWASRSHKEVAEAVPDGLKFFALELLKNRSLVLKLVREVEELGFKALVLTCDHPVHIDRSSVPLAKANIVPDDMRYANAPTCRVLYFILPCSSSPMGHKVAVIYSLQFLQLGNLYRVG